MIGLTAIIVLFGLGPLILGARSRRIGYLPFALTAATYSTYALAGIFVYATDGDPPFAPSGSWKGLFLDDDLNVRAAGLVVLFLGALYAGFFSAAVLGSRFRLTPSPDDGSLSIPKIDAAGYRVLWTLGLGMTLASFAALPGAAFAGAYSVADGAFPFLFFSVYLLMAASTLLLGADGFSRERMIATAVITVPLLWLGIRQPFVYFAGAVTLVMLRKRRITPRWIAALVVGLLVLGFVGLFRGEKNFAAIAWSDIPLAPFQYAIYEGAFTYYNMLSTLALVELRPGLVVPGQGLMDIVVQFIPTFFWPEKYNYMALWNLQDASPIALRPFGTFFGLAQVYLQGREAAVVLFGFLNGVVLRWLGRELAITRRATLLGLVAFAVPLLSLYMVRGTIAGAVVMIVRFVGVPAVLLVIVKAILRLKPDLAAQARVDLSGWYSHSSRRGRGSGDR